MNVKKTILVSGATGLVGGALIRRLTEDPTGCYVVAAVRRHAQMPYGVKQVQVGDMLPTTDWRAALRNIDAVVHCAARVHVMRDEAIDPLQAYREVNVLGTINLAKQAVQAGVRRFVFVSSIKVNGEVTQTGEAFSADDQPKPLDPYGVSKLEAEQGLQEIAMQTGLELVIVRPPLVYGPGVKANFAAMLRWVKSGIPLPLGSISNVRSMVALDNLVDLLVICLHHPAAVGQTWMVSDGEDVSTSELLQRTATAMGQEICLISIPVVALKWAAFLIGKREFSNRLCDSLKVDIEKTRSLLGWKPILTLDQGLKKTVEDMRP